MCYNETMKNKFHKLLLGCALAVSVLTGASFTSKTTSYREVKADDPTDVFYIGSHELTEDVPILGDSGQATLVLTDTEAIITLDNFTYSGAGYFYDFSTKEVASLYAKVNTNRDLSIVVIGENSFVNTSIATESSGMYFSLKDTTNLYFKSGGDTSVLTAIGSNKTSSYSYGIYVSCGNVFFQGPTVNAISGNSATLDNSSTRYCYGFYLGEVTSRNFEVRIESGALYAVGRDGKNSCGAIVHGDVYVSGNDTILSCSGGNTVNSEDSNGFYGFTNKVLKLTGGTTNLFGHNYGAYGSVKIDVSQSADFTIEGETAAFSSTHGIVTLKNSIIGYSWDGNNVRSSFNNTSTSARQIDSSIKKLVLKEIQYVTNREPDVINEVQYTGEPISSLAITVARPKNPNNYVVRYRTESVGDYNLVNAPKYTEPMNQEVTIYFQITAESDYHTVVGSRKFKIVKADGAIAKAAVGATNLVYNGKAQDLLATLPTGNANGTIEYSVNGGIYTTNAPKGTNAGDYTIYYRVMADNYHNLSENPASITVTIDKAASSYRSEPKVIEGLEYTGEAQRLITAGSVEHGTIYYKVGEDGIYSTTVPTAKNVGEYTVYYKLDGGDNYKDIEEATLTAKISKTDQSDLESAIDSAKEYYEKIKEEDPDTAAALDEKITEAKAVLDDDNQSAEDISKAYDSLEASVKNAHATIVISRIALIPDPVEYTEECYAKMTRANELYAALSSKELRKKVTNYSVLTAANVTFVKLSIDQIGDVVYTDECKALIDTARSYYARISGAERQLVSNYSVLLAAEETYAKLKDDIEASKTVIKLIDDIGDFDFSDDYNAKIVKAREAYNALTADQQALVDNLATLETDEFSYSQVNNVVKKIAVIGEVKYPTSEKAISEAREVYDDLQDELKEFVTNGDVLEAAETFYNEVDNAFILIDAIGEVEYPDSGDAISSAKEAYEALTNKQKAFVTNYGSLVEANELYNEIDSAVKSIKAIGEVKYPDSEEAIINARKIYDALSDEAKVYVIGDTYEILLDAEELYDKLAEEHETADEVITIISRIGTVEYSLSCFERIEVARKAYESLANDEEKSYVTNYDVLTSAETTYAALKADNDAANDAIATIKAIGDVEASDASKEKITLARNTYNGLTDEQKKLVSSEVLAVLTQAEDNYVRQVNARANWFVVGYAIGGVFAFLILLYLLVFFLFNKWALIDGKVVRAVKIGNKYGAVKMLVMPLKVVYCDKDIIFNRKAKAKKAKAELADNKPNE